MQNNVNENKQHSYVVLGYGIPDDILTDRNYSTYLSIAFNTIVRTLHECESMVKLIVCGGATDTTPPFSRVESAELAKWFHTQIQATGDIALASRITITEESSSVSTLENIYNAKKLLEGDEGAIVIFSEYTRAARVEILAKELFGEGRTHVVPIDFDTTMNRYHDPMFIHSKEEKSLTHDMWALKDSNHMKRHHELYAGRIDFMREHHGDISQIQEWWKNKLKVEWDYMHRTT